MQNIIQQLKVCEIGGVVDESTPDRIIMFRSHHHSVLAVGSDPESGRVPEIFEADAGRGEEDGVAGVFDPIEEEGIGRVEGVCETLKLGEIEGVATVEHDDLAVGEDGGGAGHDALDVVPVIGNHGEREVEPVD